MTDATSAAGRAGEECCDVPADPPAPGMRRAYRFAKRAFDVVLSLAVVVVALALWPVTLAVLLAAGIQAKASPLYVQRRVGRGGRPFGCLKLRTMVGDADDAEKYLNTDQLAQWERERKVDGDPRITPVGRVLRATSLDEVPQFLNVLAGQMSVVGPRPVVAEELGNFEPEEQRELLSVRPGVTGWWQVTDRNGATWESGERQALELHYVRNAGLAMDARVVARTFSVMFGKRRSGR